MRDNGEEGDEPRDDEGILHLASPRRVVRTRSARRRDRAERDSGHGVFDEGELGLDYW